MNSIDIDVGGTFTDLVLTRNGSVTPAKSPTTPYDLSVCFLNVIEEAAKNSGMTAEQLLGDTQIIRYSTTIAMNRLIERSGPRLALITTEGHEDAILIGRGAQWVDGTRVAERRNLAVQNKPMPIIPPELIVGVRERVDSTGKVVRPMDEADVRAKVHRLVNNGARGFVVSLLWSFVNPAHEQRVKEIIREEYKDYHLGSAPVVLSSEVLGKLGEYERTMTSVLDAYLQRAMQIELSAMWDRLRDKGYRGSFQMIHNSGGIAEIFKTTASRTYNGGPVAGLIGAQHIAKQLGYHNVVTSDVGGTSFDIGLIVQDAVRNYEFRPIIDRWMVGITMLQTLSIGAGGGSIAKVNRALGNRLEVGPQSAGSLPGPACYNLGGTAPTVTDANVVLGYIDPDYFYGGKMKLDKAKAEQVVQQHIARPLGVSVHEAAWLIRQVVEGNMASAIRKEVHLRGYNPDDFVLFAFGGGGPTHVAGYKQDIKRAVIFPLSPVFCALGSSILDNIHVYEKSQRMMFIQPFTQQFVVDQDQFNAVVTSLIDVAKLDLAGEGFDPDQAIFQLELDMLYGGQVQVKRTSSPELFIRGEAYARAIYDEFEREFAETFSRLVVNPAGGVYVDNFVLKAVLPTVKLNLPTRALEGPSPAYAQRGSRLAFWPEHGDLRETNVYDGMALRPGNVVEGPALVETQFTTIVVPPGLIYSINQHELGILE
ncbi:MAG: hydantoinase/oxoprolinase family protein [Chloroflexi bacterium]|nr:hydantoinase/oxoprolinase family protein [Chloroflexota bacterium]